MKPCLKKFALGAVMLAATAILSTAPMGFSVLAQPATTAAPTSAAPSEATIKSLQEALSQQGIAVKTDGILNEETRAAIRTYQSQHHLPVTGEPDTATLDKLGVSVASGTAPAGQAAQAPTAPGMAGPMMGHQMMQTRPQGMMEPGMTHHGMMGGQMPSDSAMPMQQGMMMCPMMPGMMGQHPGMMGQHPGMMRQQPGMMGQHPGMMRQQPGMMGQHPGTMPMTGGMAGQGRGATGYGVVRPSMTVSADDVRHHFDRLLQRQGNPRVKLGEIKEADKDTIVAEIVTAEGSLVDRFNVDRRSGAIQRAP